MQTTSADAQCLTNYQHIDLNGRRQKTSRLKKIDELVKKDKRGYLLEVDVEYRNGLHKNHRELPFLVEKMKIGKREKLVPNLQDENGYVVHI